MISVISISNRKNGLDLIKTSLDWQTHRDFEWVVVSPLQPDLFMWQEMNGYWIKEPPKSKDLHNLNKAYNAAIKASKGSLIVSIQDFIWFPPDSLSKFWFRFLQDPTACVSGVGNIYSDLDSSGMPVNLVWRDPRMLTGEFRECLPIEWELNFASMSRQAVYSVGGFDEDYDKETYGMDNVNLAERMYSEGYKFFLDETNECRGLKHDRVKDWDKRHANKGFHEKRMLEISQGKIPVKLDFLG